MSRLYRASKGLVEKADKPWGLFTVHWKLNLAWRSLVKHSRCACLLCCPAPPVIKSSAWYCFIGILEHWKLGFLVYSSITKLLFMECGPGGGLFGGRRLVKVVFYGPIYCYKCWRSVNRRQLWSSSSGPLAFESHPYPWIELLFYCTVFSWLFCDFMWLCVYLFTWNLTGL